MHCSQTFQFVTNRQENIPRKHDECLICLLVFECQPVYLCKIYALQFYLTQEQLSKGGRSGRSEVLNLVLYSCDVKDDMYV